MLFFENSIGILNWERRGPYLHPVPFLISQTCNLLNHASNHIISHFKSLISPSSIISQSHFLVHFFSNLDKCFSNVFFHAFRYVLQLQPTRFGLSPIISCLVCSASTHLCWVKNLWKTGLFQSSFIFLYLMGDLHIRTFFELPLSSSMRSVHTHPNPLMA